MSARTANPVNLVILGGGLALMLAGYGLYSYFSPSPHGYLEVVFALPVFCLGLAFTGAAFLTRPGGRFRPARLLVGWALVLLAVSPILFFVWIFLR